MRAVVEVVFCFLFLLGMAAVGLGGYLLIHHMTKGTW